jgi:tetrahydromethanopterin S-methyltransferase subunit G
MVILNLRCDKYNYTGLKPVSAHCTANIVNDIGYVFGIVKGLVVRVILNLLYI